MKQQQQQCLVVIWSHPQSQYCQLKVRHRVLNRHTIPSSCFVVGGNFYLALNYIPIYSFFLYIYIMLANIAPCFIKPTHTQLIRVYIIYLYIFHLVAANCSTCRSNLLLLSPFVSVCLCLCMQLCISVDQKCDAQMRRH